MKKVKIILVHLLFWVIRFTWSIAQEFQLYTMRLISSQEGSSQEEFLSNINIMQYLTWFLPILSFYFGYYFVFKSYSKQAKFWRALLLGIAFSILMSIVYVLQINFPTAEIASWHSIFFEYILFPSFFMLKELVFVAMGFIMHAFINWFTSQKEKKALIQKNHQMELALVKAQLDPHFLFNTLNNIDALIQKDPSNASAYLNQLSDIMRFMLFEAKTEKIQLNKEVDYILKFLDLQKIRSTNPDFIQFEIKGKLEEQAIPPMLFIPFIENAFKHLADNTAKGAVKIQLNVEGSIVDFTCENNYSETSQPTDKYNGLGIELIQKRLDLLYPKKHALKVTKRNGIYTTQLSLNND